MVEVGAVYRQMHCWRLVSGVVGQKCMDLLWLAVTYFIVMLLVEYIMLLVMCEFVTIYVKRKIINKSNRNT